MINLLRIVESIDFDDEMVGDELFVEVFRLTFYNHE